jgi:hypothetical protein
MSTAMSQSKTLPLNRTQAALTKVNATVDLDWIRRKLADTEDGPGWSDEKTAAVEREYRRFLALCLAEPSRPTVPYKEVDEMWHAHILDTEKYARDCQNLFGFFYHHFPYFGMRGAEDAQNLRDAYDETIARYEAAFGTPQPETWPQGSGRSCRTKCRPMRCK